MIEPISTPQALGLFLAFTVFTVVAAFAFHRLSQLSKRLEEYSLYEKSLSELEYYKALSDQQKIRADFYWDQLLELQNILLNHQVIKVQVPMKDMTEEQAAKYLAAEVGREIVNSFGRYNHDADNLASVEVRIFKSEN